jgi:hypothetical protein
MARSTQYRDNTDTTRTDAYLDGLEDGAAWDLDGYGGDAAKAAEDDGWDTATVNAMGQLHVLRVWGVESAESDDYEVACRAYNAGVKAALLQRAS